MRKYLSNIIVGLVLSFFALSLSATSYIVWKDMNFIPISNVTAESISAYPGEIVKIIFKYTRLENPRYLVVEDRFLICDDGSTFIVEAFEDDTASWPIGVDQTSWVIIKIPTKISRNQDCYYWSKTIYYRYILAPIIYKMPPKNAVIHIL